MTVSELAEQLGLACEGDGGREITGAAPLETAGPVQLAFVGSRKLWEAARLSPAVLIATPDCPLPQQTWLRAPDPRAAFARAVALLHPAPRPAPGIHPTAVVALDAHLAEDVHVGPHVTVGARARLGRGTIVEAGTVVGDDVQIGKQCRLYPRVTLYHGVTLGDRVTLHSGSVIGADGFGFALMGDHYAKFPQVGTVEIGDDVEIGANTCVDRAALGVTLVGAGTKLDNMVHVGHNCRIGRHVVVAAQTGLSGGVVVEDYAVIGGQVGIGDKARIESRAVLGSGCGVLTSKVVRAGQVMWGVPARPLKEHLAQLAHLARLPALRQEVAELRRRLDRQEPA